MLCAETLMPVIAGAFSLTNPGCRISFSTRGCAPPAITSTGTARLKISATLEYGFPVRDAFIVGLSQRTFVPDAMRRRYQSFSSNGLVPGGYCVTGIAPVPWHNSQVAPAREPDPWHCGHSVCVGISFGIADTPSRCHAALASKMRS